MLKLAYHNTKMHRVAAALSLTRRQVAAFDIPAGWTCPSALDCKATADRITGKITDGAGAKFRCYAASSEARYKLVRRARWHNFTMLRSAGTMARMAALLTASIPDSIKVLRIHSSGDFFNLKYFNAWIRTAQQRQDITFYGYTKQAQYLDDITLPDNMRLVISAGGRNNDAAPGIARAHVVYSMNQEYPVYNDVESELAIIERRGTFGILVHGTQPAGFYNRIAQIDLQLT